MNDTLLIAGGGQAGFSVASKLRKLGDDRPITIICDEIFPPYQRPPLSKKYLLGETKKERLFFRSSNWYQENNVDLRLGATLGAISAKSKNVCLKTGEKLEYQKLVLSMGARALTLPEAFGGHHRGVYSIRTLSDVDTIKHEFQPGRTLLVVGGGYVGLEAASTANKLGLKVILIEREDRILKRVAAVATSNYFRELHVSKGVQIHESTSLINLTEKEGRVSGAVLSSGENIGVDFVICGIGIKPNDELAKEAGLDVSDGIIVNNRCQTSDPDILAAGDCASFLYQNNLIRLESVQNAIDQGEAVAETLFGIQSSYKPYPWFWSDQFDVKLQIAGLNSGYDQTLVRKGAREGGQSVWYFKKGTLIAVDAMNDATSYLIASRLIRNNVSPSAEIVVDSNYNLKSLLN